LMREAGCVEVLIGFESPVADGLDDVELRANWKLRRFPQYRRAIHTIQSHGIRVNACFVVGLDGHGPGIFDAVYDFVEQTTPFDVQITYPTPFPGTPMYEQFRRSGRLLKDEAWERCTLFDINFRPARMTPGELRAGFHDLARRLYDDAFTAYRKDTFRSRYLRGGRKERPITMRATA